MNWNHWILITTALILSLLVNAHQEARITSGECLFKAVHYGEVEQALKVVCP